MSSYLKSFFFSFFLLNLMFGLQLFGGFINNEFIFTYPLDDVYIHLEMGKNLAEHGSWSTIPGEFHSSSSSPLYTILIAFFYLIGLGGFALPYVLNYLFAVGLLLALKKMAEIYYIDKWHFFFAANSLVFISPLYHTIFLGMEHTLHIALIIPTVFLISKYLTEQSNVTISLKLSLLVILSSAARYESLFIFFIVGIILLYKRRLMDAGIIGIAALLPPIIYGFISISKGEFFLPNSLLVKGIRPGEYDLLYYIKYIFRWLKLLILDNYLLVAMVIPGGVFYDRIKRKQYDSGFYYALITIATLILHLTFARTGWLYRYESYLMAMCLVALFWFIPLCLRQNKTKYLYVFVIVALIFMRTMPVIINTKHSMKNIHNQQIQIKNFASKFYSNGTIVINDIGAISYYTDINYIDLWSLANTETARFRLENNLNLKPEFTDSLARSKNATVAIIYNEVLTEIPKNWKEAGYIQTKKYPDVVYNKIHFYAINADLEELKKNLKEYSEELDSQTKVKLF